MAFFSAGKGEKYVRNQIFIKGTRKVFYQILAKCGKHDSYYSSFFYCVGISEDTRNHVDRMFDFKERLIKPEALYEGWQTDGTTYWSWYGFGSRVECCACFVSWCADQSGYIQSGVIPKFSLCLDGVWWNRQYHRRQQWG